ncbi:hypothetical protein FH972_022949 [Carpinus fangiana]|uniref:Uncharacterized protein n=1 Tax=Carpinus fangiana TaxID=176857 RepID=A0A5N6KU13_9ROSI|nr:hypothetical protein FH972_022949 [Carpinus fangiana]
MELGPPWPTHPYGTPPTACYCSAYYPPPIPNACRGLCRIPLPGRMRSRKKKAGDRPPDPRFPPHVQVLHGEDDKYFYIETPAFDIKQGSSSMAKKFFNRRPKGPFDHSTFACRQNVTIASLINRMGGDAERGDYLIEALEQGHGIFYPGQILRGSGDVGKKEAKDFGFTHNRGTKNSPVWLVLITTKDKKK